MGLSPQKMGESILRNLPIKTGKTIEEWLKLAEDSGLEDKKSMISWLKSEHNLGHVTAQIITAKKFNKHEDYSNPEKLFEELFKGRNPELINICQKVVEEFKKLGSGTTIRNCKTYISLDVRNIQSGIIYPVFDNEIGIGLALKDMPETQLFERRKGPASVKITHYVKINSVEDIDDEILVMMKKAYALV